MTTTETAPVSPPRPALSRWLAAGVCLLTGFRIGVDAAVLTGATGASFGAVDVVLRICAMAVLASLVLRGMRNWLGLAVACLAYSLTVALVQLPGHPTWWTALLLAHQGVLIVAVLGLWLAGIRRPPPDRLKLATAVAAGVAAGAALRLFAAGVV